MTHWSLFNNSYQLRNFKGPLSLPLIGCCWDTGVLMFYKHMMNLRKRYGKVFAFFSFHKPLLIICEPSVARRILSDPKTFYKGRDYTESFHIAFGIGLVTSNGEDHRLGRQLFGKYFIRSSVAQHAEAFDSITTKLMTDHLAPIVGKSKDSVKLNIEDFFARLALRNFMMFSCHIDTSVDPKQEHEICTLVSQGSYSMVRMILLKEPNLSIFPNAAVMHKFNRVLKAYFHQCVDERTKLLAAGETFDDSLTVLMADNALSEQDRLDHFKTLISAGHDTTAFFMSYMAYLLARNPVIQEKLHD